MRCGKTDLPHPRCEAAVRETQERVHEEQRAWDDAQMALIHAMRFPTTKLVITASTEAEAVLVYRAAKALCESWETQTFRIRAS